MERRSSRLLKSPWWSAFAGMTAGWLALAPIQAFGSEVVAVLSSDLTAYQKAWDGFAEEFGRQVPLQNLAKGEPVIPPEARLIIALGGKAAMYPYPPHKAVVYLMAPGVLVPTAGRKAPLTEIDMTPSAPAVIRQLKELQPALARLGILVISSSRDEFDAEMRQEGQKLGVNVSVRKLETLEELPDTLRSLKPQVDALWIPPDPFLLTPQGFRTLAEFSRSNGIPLYVPSVQLLEQGATGAVVASFKEIGRRAATVAKGILAGAPEKSRVYPERFQTVVNAAAVRSGWVSSKAAEKVIP